MRQWKTILKVWKDKEGKLLRDYRWNSIRLLFITVEECFESRPVGIKDSVFANFE